MGQEGFAGVTIPEYGASSGEQISEPKGEETTSPETGGQTEAVKSQASDLVDLDKLERFRFGGRELTTKDLQSSFMRHSDYTKKTQELAEARKYADNFEADLSKVIANPQLLAEMKKLYPAPYVQLAEKYLSQQQSAQPEAQGQEDKLPPKMAEALQRIERWEQQQQEQLTQSTLEQMNTLHERLAGKYPYADADVVDTRLQIAIDKGMEITRENISKVMENAYKQHHEAIKKRLDADRKVKVEEQVKAGKMAKDVGTGGGPPGSPPKKYKKLSDVTKDVIASFESK